MKYKLKILALNLFQYRTIYIIFGMQQNGCQNKNNNIMHKAILLNYIITRPSHKILLAT